MQIYINMYTLSGYSKVKVFFLLSLLVCFLLNVFTSLSWAENNKKDKQEPPVLEEHKVIDFLPSRIESIAPSVPLTAPIVPERPAPQSYPEELETGIAEDLGVEQIIQESVNRRLKAEKEKKESEEVKLKEPKLPKISPLFVPRSPEDVLSRADLALDKTAGEIVSLPMLLEKILSNHPDLEMVATYVFEKHGDLSISRSQGLPQLSVDVSAGPKWTTYPETRKDPTLNYGTSSIKLTQTFFDFGAVRKDVLASKYSIEVAEINLRKAIDDMAFAIAMYYLDVLQSQEIVYVRSNEVAFYQSLKNAYSLRYSAGESSLSDVQKMDVSLQTAESNLVGALQNLRMAKDTLETLLGGTHLGLFKVYAPLFAKKMNASLENLLASSMKSSLSLAAVEKNIASSESKLESLKSDRLPKLGYNVGASSEGEEDDFNVSYNAQVTLSWTLDNGNKEGQITKIRATLRRHKANLRLLKIQLTDRVKNAYNDYQAATRELSLAREAKKQSILLTKNYFQEIDLGVRTLLDLVSAKEGEVQAELRETNSRFRRVKSLMGLYLEVGKITDCLPVSKNDVDGIVRAFGIHPISKTLSFQ